MMVVLEPKEQLAVLLDHAGEVRVLAHLQVRMYLRSGIEMIRMAGIYLDEKNYVKAFVLYNKYAILVLQKLPAHPEYRCLSDDEIKAAKKRAKMSISMAEEIKKKLLAQWQEDYQKYEQELERRAKAEQLGEKLANTLSLQENHANSQSGDDAMAQAEKEDFNRRIAIIKEQERLRGLSEVNTTPTNTSKPRSPLQPSISPSTAIPSGYSLASTLNNSSLRRVAVPAILENKFAGLAMRNTSKNIETCGILCGKMSQEHFTVTHVVLPKQTGTADSCTTSNEEELMKVLEDYDVITLGWIHTHPSQSAFLSSVDLHTHFGYQSMMPEAIAIVYAPTHKQYFSFSITNHGLKVLSGCRETGFHYHAKDPPLFQVSDHVVMEPNLGITTVDLRLE